MINKKKTILPYKKVNKSRVNSIAKKFGKYHGFTLVELLVVIAIISVLAGMLMPALENSISSARTISCNGNFKQIGQSVLFYIDDFDDWTPMVRNIDVGGYYLGTVLTKLYFDHPEISVNSLPDMRDYNRCFVCPCAPMPDIGLGGDSGHKNGSYAMSERFSTFRGAGKPGHFRFSPGGNINTFGTPKGAVPLMYEAVYSFISVHKFYVPDQTLEIAGMWNILKERHPQPGVGMNILFNDLHVSYHEGMQEYVRNVGSWYGVNY